MPSYRDNGSERMPNSDELLRGLGLSGDGEVGDDTMSPTEDAVPLGFDPSTDTRHGNSRGRRGSGARLGDGQRQQRNSQRPTAGMVTEDETLRRRQEAFRKMAGGRRQYPQETSRGYASPSSSNPAVARSMASQARNDVSAPPQIDLSSLSYDGTGESSSSEDIEHDETRGKIANFMQRVAGKPSPAMPKNPITFIRQYGIGSFPIWVYEYKLLLLPVAIFALVIGMMFNRYISLVIGIIIVALGWAAERQVEENDAILMYVLGIATALVPFVM